MDNKGDFETFYLSFGPGLERVAQLELVKFWAAFSGQFFFDNQLDTKFFNGGIEFKSPLVFIEKIKNFLKIPQKILHRKFTQEVSDFKTLEHILSEYFKSHPCKECQLHFSSRSSFINNEKSVARTMSKFKIKINKNAERSIYLRFFRDEMTLSEDLTPKGLYKRGERVFVGDAPIRETLAAAILQWSLMGDWDSEWTIFDPMMGSGVFITEALGLQQLNQFIPQVAPQLKVKKLIGIEKDRKTFEAAKKNFDLKTVDILNEDFFKIDPAIIKTIGKSLLISNLPYGERIKVNKNFYDLVSDKISNLKFDRVCLIIPQKVNLKKIDNLSLVRSIYFSNGGIPVKAVLYSKDVKL